MIGPLDALLRDLRSSIRMLAARPAWTAAAVVCLAIATGANTAAFSLVNGLLLRPLPFDQPDRLVMIALRERSDAGPRPFALREYRELSEASGEVAMLMARTFFPLSLSADDGAQMAQAEVVSANYFETLRVKPFAGRFFDSSADRAGGDLQAVLSHALWRRRFGADVAVLGRSMRVNGRPVIVMGIAPPGFVGAMQLVAADLWLPAAIYTDLARSADADRIPMFGVMGRLAPGISANEAEVRLTSIAAARGRAQSPDTPPAVIVTAASGFAVPVAAQGTMLALSSIIYAMMALLMAVACANVAALVLARGAGRTREIAVRLSLGASRMHIARQLLTESVALALVGCAAGTIVALWLTQALVARLTTPFQYVNYAIDVHPDGRVLAYSAIATALAAVLCGISPIRYAARVDVVEVLKQSGTRGRARASRRPLDVMVVVQFAVSTALLAGAGMLVRAYVTAQSAQPAFETGGVITATLDVDQIGVGRAAGTRLYDDVRERVAALPGVTAVSLTRDLPFRSAGMVHVTTATGTGAAGSDQRAAATASIVSPGYFEMLGIAVREGRPFRDGEPARPQVAIINDSMARRFWPGASPLGRIFRLQDGDPIEVIGIVPDGGEPARTEHTQPAFYRPFPNEYSSRMTLLIRAPGDPGPVFTELRRTIREVNRDLAIVDLRTLDDLANSIAAQRRGPATVLSLVALLGLLLSAVGLYGVIACGVRERAREIGIRLALGARPADVRRLVLRQGFTIAAIGLGAGAGATAALTQALRSRWSGVIALDPAILAVVSAVLIAAAAAALYLPARWASRVAPAHTLRAE